MTPRRSLALAILVLMLSVALVAKMLAIAARVIWLKVGARTAWQSPHMGDLAGEAPGIEHAGWAGGMLKPEA